MDNYYSSAGTNGYTDGSGYDGQMPPVEQPKKGFLQRIPKLVWILVALAIVVAIAIPVIGALSNTYETPIAKLVEFQNNRNHSDIDEEWLLGVMNGFLEKEHKALIAAMKKSDDYEDNIEELGEEWESHSAWYEDEYGEDYKFSYEIEDKEELEKASLRAFKASLKEIGGNILGKIETIEDTFDSDDWLDLADELEMSKAEAKKLVKELEAFGEALKDVEVTEGYELNVILLVEGEELDEAEENEEVICVYKVNGRWITDRCFTGPWYGLFDHLSPLV